MSDILSIVIIAVVYIAVAFAGNKKKQAKNAKTRARSRRRADFEQMKSAQSAQADERQSLKRPERAADCARRPIHLHEATQEEMRRAGEGEDPCHAGGASEMSSPIYDQEIGRESFEFGPSDVLRGVIMSEVLTRPQQRAAMKRNGRRI